MKPLSREASAALSALKSPEPSAADEARVRQNLERTLGVVIPVAGVAVGTSVAAQAASGASSAASGATALSVGAKVVGFVVAVGLGTTLTVGAAKALMSPAAAPVAVKAVAVAAPPPKPVVQNTVVEEAVVQPPEVEVTLEEPPAIAAAPAPKPSKSAPVVRASPAKLSQEEEPTVAEAPPVPVESPPVMPTEAGPTVPPAPPNTQESYDVQIETQFPNCDAATEMRSALNARKLLLVNRAEEAVGLLEAYQRRCPSGRWSNEAWTVRVGGLCMLGRNSEARGFLDWFSSESPERRAAVVGDLHQWCSPELLKP